MKNYIVLTVIRGLRRAEPWRRHQPILPDEVIALPFDVAASLEQAAAIAETDADVTAELDFSGDPVPAIRDVGGVARVVAAADVDELRRAVEAIGADASLRPATAIVPDPDAAISEASDAAILAEAHCRLDRGAIGVSQFLDRASNFALVSELCARIDGGLLSAVDVQPFVALAQLSGTDAGDSDHATAAPPAAPAVDAATGDADQAVVQPASASAEVEAPEPAPAAAKPKARAKKAD